MSASFKQKLQEAFIPCVKELISKEEAHLVWLKENRKLLRNRLLVDRFIERSTNDLAHYRMRLQQYIEYAEKL